MLTITEIIRFFTCGIELSLSRTFDTESPVQSCRLVVKNDISSQSEVATIDMVGIVDASGAPGKATVRFELTKEQTLLLTSLKQFYISVLCADGSNKRPYIGEIYGDDSAYVTDQVAGPAGGGVITPALPSDMTLDWDASLGAGAGGSLQERVQGKHASIVAGAPWFRSSSPPLLMMDGNDGLEVTNVPVPQGDYSMMGVVRIDSDSQTAELWGWNVPLVAPAAGNAQVRDFVIRSSQLDLTVSSTEIPIGTGYPIVSAAKGPALTPYYMTVCRRVTSDVFELYINGRLVASQGRGDSSIDKRRGTPATFAFGKQPGSSALFMIGGVGRLFIVDGRAMSSAEIEAAHLKLMETYTRLPAPGSLQTPQPVPVTNLTNDWSPAGAQFTDRVGGANAPYDAGGASPTLQSTWPPLALFSGAQGAAAPNVSTVVPFSALGVVRLDSLAINAAAMHIMGLAPVGTDAVTYHKRLALLSDAINGALVAKAQATPLTLTAMATEPAIKNGGTFPAYLTLGFSIDTSLVMRLYVNGTLRGSADLGSASDFPNEPAAGSFTFGRTPTNTEYLTGAAIGRTLRWSRALTDAEFAVAHNALREQYERLPLV